MKYTGGVSCACNWVSTAGETLNFGYEANRTLPYLKDLRARVYAEAQA